MAVYLVYGELSYVSWVKGISDSIAVVLEIPYETLSPVPALPSFLIFIIL